MYFVLLPLQYRTPFTLSVLWFAPMILSQLFCLEMYSTNSSNSHNMPFRNIWKKVLSHPSSKRLNGLLLLQLEDSKETWISFQKQALQSSIQQAISTLSNFSVLFKKKKKIAWYLVKIQSLISFPFPSEHHFYIYVHFEISTTGWQLSMLSWARRLLPPVFTSCFSWLSCWR